MRVGRFRRAHPGNGRSPHGPFGAGARPHSESGAHGGRPGGVADGIRQARGGSGAVRQPGPELLGLRLLSRNGQLRPVPVYPPFTPFTTVCTRNKPVGQASWPVIPALSRATAKAG